MRLKRKTTFLIWFIICSLISLFFHFFVFKKIGNLEITSFNPSSFDKIIPRRFHLERVKIDPKLLEIRENKNPALLITPAEISLSEKKEFSEQPQPTGVKPRLLKTDQLAREKPDALLENNIIPPSDSKPSQLPFDPLTKESSLGEIASQETLPATGYSELDQLIEEKKPLSSQTAPILLPTDLLFEYDADQLKEGAQESLKKLALLIQRNPKAHFIVEGFTDSFGSDAYNLDLSTRRANSIKQWLLSREHIDPMQVQSYGLGKTHFIVPSSGSIEEQSLNRRVEVVIRQQL